MARRGRRQPFFLLMLFARLAQNRDLPLGTMLLLGLNIFVHLFTDVPLQHVCLRPSIMLRYHDYLPLLLAGVFHVDDIHLYYNMISLAMKGRTLERHMGIVSFLWLTVLLLVASNIIFVGASFALAEYFDYPEPFYHQCVAGFSAVLFGMKVVANWNSPGSTRYWGMTLPTKYLAWAELVFISIITPNASFLGHLCGIAAGWLYMIGVFRIFDFIPKSIEAAVLQPGHGGGGGGGYDDGYGGGGGYNNNGYGGGYYDQNPRRGGGYEQPRRRPARMVNGHLVRE